MLEILGTDIYLTRGDTAYLNIDIINPLTEDSYILQAGDILTFTLRKYMRSGEILLQKVLAAPSLVLEPEDTENLEFGTYYYDIELQFADGDVNTIISPSKFCITGEVTY